MNEQEEELWSDLGRFSQDPYAFVMWAFAWGEEGSDLALDKGPEAWQEKLLKEIRDGIRDVAGALQFARTSGHGIGKSAFVSWIILWAVSTCEDTKGVVTANTETQLKTKTWAELARWFGRFIAKDLFEYSATRIAIRTKDTERQSRWKIDMVPWSERNTEAFAGLHNKGKRILVVFDEASAIPDTIWETTEGALTDSDTEILWLVFGNPTRNFGRFKDCFPGGRFSHRWNSNRIDSREVSFTNKDQIADWVKDYGDDSDFVRVRVKGEWPRSGTQQFIASDLVADARKRTPEVFPHDPLVLGVDVARFGGDDTVIYIRKGRDGRTYPPIIMQPTDSSSAWTVIVANRVSEIYARFHADAVFVDEGGVGAGVVDQLRNLHVPVIGVQFGSKPDRAAIEGNDGLYANKRAEMWGFMRDWLRGGSIPDDEVLAGELISPEFGYNIRNEIQLEKKEDMRKRGLRSPDRADALALTFAYAVQPHALAGMLDRAPVMITDYDPFSREAMAL